MNKPTTWKDFPDFYENDIIKRLAPNPLWTVSTTKAPKEGDKTKMPIDMYAFINMGKIWGVAFDRGWHPLLDLHSLCEVLPDAINNAYYLDARRDKIVVLDIEPECPDALKQQFLQLPFLYGETSMSGKGYHLVFDFPEDIFNKYPNAQKASMHPEPANGYYEILQNHTITFTRNTVPRSKNPKDVQEFRNLYEMIAMQQKPSVSEYDKLIASKAVHDIPHADEIVYDMTQVVYQKTLKDFPKIDPVTKQAVGYDNSAYEFGISGFYYRILQQILPNYSDYTYTDEDIAVLIYTVVESIIEYRTKHDQTRNRMPWLLYIASTVIRKSS